MSFVTTSTCVINSINNNLAFCFSKSGDVIHIHSKKSDGWWLGELKGVTGVFPATYVVEID